MIAFRLMGAMIGSELRNGNEVQAHAAVALIRVNGDEQDKICNGKSFGVGAVDAVFKAINNIARVKPTIVFYGIKAVTGSSESAAHATVTIDFKCVMATGVSIHDCTIIASAEAYVEAINQLLERLEKIKILRRKKVKRFSKRRIKK